MTSGIIIPWWYMFVMLAWGCLYNIFQVIYVDEDNHIISQRLLNKPFHYDDIIALERKSGDQLIIKTKQQTLSIRASGSVLSKVTETSAKPIGRYPSAPTKITSSILEPRIFLVDSSPSTQRIASVILDLPDPLGPTMTVVPASKVITVFSGKDLKPCSSRLFSRNADSSFSFHSLHSLKSPF